MNIVDLVSSQLTGDVLGKLGGLIGANESQTRTASNAAVPALLSALAGLASTNNGADKLASAMGGLDLKTLGNLAGLLGGGQASSLGSTGGNLLGSVLGSNGLSSIVGTLATFAGMQPGIMKTLLTYLARHAGTVVTRAELMTHVWDDSGPSYSNIIDVYASRLRRTIDDGESAALFTTVRGTGFVLEAPGTSRRGTARKAT